MYVIPVFEVREIMQSDIALIVNYWMTSSTDHLIGMGVDLKKMPPAEQLTFMLSEQINQSYEEKKSYCIIWLYNGIPIGHCNINKIVFGSHAYMHLHIWNGMNRKKGTGVELIKRSVTYFFENMKLKKLYCEPYALNPAPNKTLAKAGFHFLKRYTTTPGAMNFEQEVNLWELSEQN